MTALLEDAPAVLHEAFAREGFGDVAGRLATIALTALRAEYGGESVYIAAPDKRARNRAIVDAARRGERKENIARRAGVSVSTVNRTLAKHHKRRCPQTPNSGFGDGSTRQTP